MFGMHKTRIGITFLIPDEGWEKLGSTSFAIGFLKRRCGGVGEKTLGIAKISMMSATVINLQTRVLLAGETKGSFVRWLANNYLTIKRNLTSVLVNK